MTNKEAIRVLKSTSVNLGRRGGKTVYAEALEMAITALQELDKKPTKPNNSNDGVKNANPNSTNEIKSRVKGMTACRVPEEDCISRQAAIDAVNAVFPVDPNRNDYVRGIACGAALAQTYIKQLPSSQPEIIRCRDCVHWTRTFGDDRWSVGDCDVFDKHLVMCKGYCAWAERRTDERTD